MDKLEIISTLKSLQAAPLKKLGQNFLICKEALSKIVLVADLQEKSNVLEIGPGLGILTQKLLVNQNKVIAVEKDAKYCSYLRKKFNTELDQQLQITQGDILTINILKLLRKRFVDNDSQPEIPEYQVVANLPYNIASKIIHLFLEIEHRPSQMTLLLQKEVAERICAKPPKMNALALTIKLVATPKIAFIIKGDCFYPKPKVDSAVITLKNINQKLNFQQAGIKNLLQLIKIGFASPRKTLLNNLINGFSLDKVELERIIMELSKKKEVRAQELTLKEWQKLNQKLRELKVVRA
ncbi:MAG: 16S rRNA (adenine(1518)-N(6)/adenine(1519)-N(6))-dimethyltransferase RsmA [Patescibacteria group bacterium]|nr:16S rRNA (adenine(1518)-N(6)/adenine(1519)-N(6))-dimethyltransferase RsmA [Patescibacteria group bacterium]